MFNMLLQFLYLRLLDLLFGCRPVAKFLQRTSHFSMPGRGSQKNNLKLRFEFSVLFSELFTFHQGLSEFLSHMILRSLRRF